MTGGPQARSANFEFLKAVDAQLFRLAALAEHYFRTDPNTSVLKLRQFAELMARDVGARAGLLAEPDQAQSQLLGALATRPTTRSVTISPSPSTL
jgi:type I restriction enzyme R subunit